MSNVNVNMASSHGYGNMGGMVVKQEPTPNPASALLAQAFGNGNGLKRPHGAVDQQQQQQQGGGDGAGQHRESPEIEAMKRSISLAPQVAAAAISANQRRASLVGLGEQEGGSGDAQRMALDAYFSRSLEASSQPATPMAKGMASLTSMASMGSFGQIQTGGGSILQQQGGSTEFSPTSPSFVMSPGSKVYGGSEHRTSPSINPALPRPRQTAAAIAAALQAATQTKNPTPTIKPGQLPGGTPNPPTAQIPGGSPPPSAGPAGGGQNSVTATASNMLSALSNINQQQQQQQQQQHQQQQPMTQASNQANNLAQLIGQRIGQSPSGANQSPLINVGSPLLAAGQPLATATAQQVLFNQFGGGAAAGTGPTGSAFATASDRQHSLGQLFPPDLPLTTPNIGVNMQFQLDQQRLAEQQQNDQRARLMQGRFQQQQQHQQMQLHAAQQQQQAAQAQHQQITNQLQSMLANPQGAFASLPYLQQQQQVLALAQQQQQAAQAQANAAMAAAAAASLGGQQHLLQQQHQVPQQQAEKNDVNNTQDTFLLNFDDYIGDGEEEDSGAAPTEGAGGDGAGASTLEPELVKASVPQPSGDVTASGPGPTTSGDGWKSGADMSISFGELPMSNAGNSQLALPAGVASAGADPLLGAQRPNSNMDLSATIGMQFSTDFFDSSLSMDLGMNLMGKTGDAEDAPLLDLIDEDGGAGQWN